MEVCALIPPLFYGTGWFYRSSDPCFKSCPVVAGVDLLEGDIEQDEVRLVASEH